MNKTFQDTKINIAYAYIIALKKEWLLSSFVVGAFELLQIEVWLRLYAEPFYRVIILI